MPKTVGFIGYKGHALRLMNIFHEIKGWKISHVYHPHKPLDVKQVPASILKDACWTNDFDDLLSCDAIVVASPNSSHFHYLKELSTTYSGYVFCEKPPVSSLKDLDGIEKFPNAFRKKLYFNFNMRNSWLYDQLTHIHQNYDLGEAVSASVIVGYGFAFKEAYSASWRSKKNFPAIGVLETMGIHYLDLLSLVYGSAGRGFYYAHKHSPSGKAKDTCHLSCFLGDKCVLNLSCSYAIPFVNRFEIHLTDGRIVCDNGDLKVFAPRDTFAADGSFVSPPLKYKSRKAWAEIYLGSLRNSCIYFAKHAEDKKSFDINLFNQSLLSNRVCLSAKSV
jgi:predicted dehydrogenase